VAEYPEAAVARTGLDAAWLEPLDAVELARPDPCSGAAVAVGVVQFVPGLPEPTPLAVRDPPPCQL